jgi:RNA polymerase sigma factor (sigma-70 family)
MLAGAAITSVTTKGTPLGVPLALDPSEPHVEERSPRTFEEIINEVRRRTYNRFRTAANVEDLVQEAAIQAWKYYMDGKSEAYIFYWVPIQMTQFITVDKPFTGNESQEVNPTRLGSTTKRGDEVRDKIKEAQKSYYNEHHELPSQAEISRMTGLAPRRVSKYMNRANFHVSTEDLKVFMESLQHAMTRVNDNDKPRNVPWILEDGFEETSVDRLLIRDVVDELNDLQKKIVFLHYWQDVATGEIAKILNKSQPYISRTHTSALKHLREILGVAA